ncbi:MAG TPA: hypothetical protein VI386_11465 [Candidatus Sulfotelmatobacter sp.]
MSTTPRSSLSQLLPPVPLQEIAGLADKKTTTSDLASAPAVVYVKDASRAYAVQAGAQTGTAYPWYEFLFYSASDNAYCQVSRYCTTEIFPSFESYTPVPKRATNMILTGIVDGPVPVPNINIANIPFQETEHTFAEVTYGFNKGGKTEHSVSSSWRFGMKTEGSVTAGFGPAWDISIQGGIGSVNENSVESSLSESKDAATLLNDATRGTGKQAILPQGQLFATNVNIDWTVFRYRDPQGNLLVDGTDKNFQNLAPLVVLTSETQTKDNAVSFPPYAVTPGTIESYTVENLNRRMQSLGYSSSRYFQEVIEPNAYGFTTDQPYLRFFWNNDGGTVDQDYEQVTTSFTESSWSLDDDVYIGVSGGGGFAGIRSRIQTHGGIRLYPRHRGFE